MYARGLDACGHNDDAVTDHDTEKADPWCRPSEGGRRVRPAGVGRDDQRRAGGHHRGGWLRRRPRPLPGSTLLDRAPPRRRSPFGPNTRRTRRRLSTVWLNGRALAPPCRVPCRAPRSRAGGRRAPRRVRLAGERRGGRGGKSRRIWARGGWRPTCSGQPGPRPDIKVAVTRILRPPLTPYAAIRPPFSG